MAYPRTVLLWVAALVAIVGAGCTANVTPEIAATPTLQPTESIPASPTAGILATEMPLATATPLPTNTPVPTATPKPLGVYVGSELNATYQEAAKQAIKALEPLDLMGMRRVVEITGDDEPDSIRLQVLPLPVALAARAQSGENSVYELALRYYVIVAPFRTITDDITFDELRTRWKDSESDLLLVTADAASDLLPVLGVCGAQQVGADDMLALLETQTDAIGILPFEALDPVYKVLTLDGVQPLSNQLIPETYPLAVELVLIGAQAPNLGPHLIDAFVKYDNRDASKLTSLVMTGVTAMCRMTADRMETYGTLYPAKVVSDVLRAADITHVSNEVPFVKDCVVNIASNNLVFCSDYDYWEALEAIGADIVGLSGNHVNDFGYDGARESIAFYRDRDIPIYGSGLNLDEACAPLIIQDHGNSLAFVATLAFQPAAAWATDDLPGTCHFYDHKDRLLKLVRELREQVDVVLIELQYLETYNPFPTGQQVDEFRELREAGAHIVTGVQSHVPQAWEPYGRDDAHGSGIIVYGLGNLFFDQMWSWETRTGLVARHTIYDGRLVNSEVLTTVLEDYAQPRWATIEERAEILQRIFEAAPSRP